MRGKLSGEVVEVSGKNWISGAEWYDAMGEKEGEK